MVEVDTTIEDLNIRKIFNSRGEETVEVEVYLVDGFGKAAAPAGASRGKYEVVYFPDNDIEKALHHIKQNQSLPEVKTNLHKDKK